MDYFTTPGARQIFAVGRGPPHDDSFSAVIKPRERLDTLIRYIKGEEAHLGGFIEVDLW